LPFLLTAFLLQATTQSWDSSILEVISRSGPVSKFVLVLLLFFSIVSWAIIADRFFAYRRARRQNSQFYRLFRKSTSLNELANTALRYRHSVFAKIYLVVFNEISQHSRSETDARSPVTVKTVGTLTTEMVNRAITRAGLSETTKLEKNLSFLATTASATPFIGLFGTVWGIINAFESIANARSTDLSIVAPGIAEALIATAMGLAAAIPAVIGYNYFVHQLRNLGAEMEEFSMELMTFLERQQIIQK
jgi:biopolymer transport protein TolQ